MTLPYDQIPPERRTIGDVTGRLGEHNGVLDVALAQWMARDDSKAQPRGPLGREHRDGRDRCHAPRTARAARPPDQRDPRRPTTPAPRGPRSCCAGVSARRAVFRATPCSSMSVVIEGSRGPGGTPANCGAN